MDKDELIRQALTLFAEAKDEFCQAHERGVDALNRRDYAGISQAIAAEYAAIEKQRAATRHLMNERSAVPVEASSPIRET